MEVLGIKCSKAELGWMVLEGTTRANATVVACNRPKVPSGERGEQLAWVRKELLEAIAKYGPDAAALAMSEGQSAIADRSQMDGVVLATLYEKQVAVTRLRSASLRSRYWVKNKDELKAAVEALPACTQKTTAPQKELLTVAAAILRK
jgi:Holliday junction resolvasome RuvABC endonuclease subunit